MINDHGVSHRQACKEAGLCRSTNEYQHKQKDDEQLIQGASAIGRKVSCYLFLAMLLQDQKKRLRV